MRNRSVFEKESVALLQKEDPDFRDIFVGLELANERAEKGLEKDDKEFFKVLKLSLIHI